ncbi:MAG TPA: cupin domain-containing protein [Micropepsaceae bacterium]|jgi:quercetin dioxygenase-like cupin family protein|nr:cupin domain-containing protein [Micropepsaceae bacterium]
MRNFAIGAVALTLAASFVGGALPVAAADAPAVVRKVLKQEDLPIPNMTEALISVTIPVGGREGKHSHPGALMVYVQSGALALDYEGKPQTTYKAGDVFFVEAGKVHEGINMGTVPAVALATFVGPKGQPITKQVE